MATLWKQATELLSLSTQVIQVKLPIIRNPLFVVHVFAVPKVAYNFQWKFKEKKTDTITLHLAQGDRIFVGK